MIHVISGAPCAGKTTFVKSKAKHGEIVVDTDAIACAIGYEDKHGCSGDMLNAALVARRALIDHILQTKKDAWIIDSLPSAESLEKYEKAGVEFIVLDPGKEVCKERAKERPNGTDEVITNWYEKSSCLISNNARNGVKLSTQDDATIVKKRSEERKTIMKRSDITAIFPEATSEQIDQLLNLNGGDINKAKGELDTIKSQFNAMQSEFNALKTKSNDANEDELNALRSELDGLKSANALRDIREKVSKEKGVPMNLLTGSTEEDCTAQADAIMEFVGSSKPSYPGLKDGGEVRTPSTTTTREKFAEWFNESNN